MSQKEAPPSVSEWLRAEQRAREKAAQSEQLGLKAVRAAKERDLKGLEEAVAEGWTPWALGGAEAAFAALRDPSGEVIGWILERFESDVAAAHWIEELKSGKGGRDWRKAPIERLGPVCCARMGVGAWAQALSAAGGEAVEAFESLKERVIWELDRGGVEQERMAMQLAQISLMEGWDAKGAAKARSLAASWLAPKLSQWSRCEQGSPEWQKAQRVIRWIKSEALIKWWAKGRAWDQTETMARAMPLEQVRIDPENPKWRPNSESLGGFKALGDLASLMRQVEVDRGGLSDQARETLAGWELAALMLGAGEPKSVALAVRKGWIPTLQAKCEVSVEHPLWVAVDEKRIWEEKRVPPSRMDGRWERLKKAIKESELPEASKESLLEICERRSLAAAAWSERVGKRLELKMGKPIGAIGLATLASMFKRGSIKEDLARELMEQGCKASEAIHPGSAFAAEIEKHWKRSGGSWERWAKKAIEREDLEAESIRARESAPAAKAKRM